MASTRGDDAVGSRTREHEMSADCRSSNSQSWKPVLNVVMDYSSTQMGPGVTSCLPRYSVYQAHQTRSTYLAPHISAATAYASPAGGGRGRGEALAATSAKP